MGSLLNKPVCMFCQNKEEEDNPMMLIYSRGKYNGHSICWACLKKKHAAKLKYEERLMNNTKNINEL